MFLTKTMQEIKNHIPYLINHMIDQNFPDKKLSIILTTFYNDLIEDNFNINFDQKYFYLIEKDQTDENKFKIELGDLPYQILEMIQQVLNYEYMSEHVKNSEKRLHFKNYKYKHCIENYHNEFRLLVFNYLLQDLFKEYKREIIEFFINKLDEIEVKLYNYVPPKVNKTNKKTKKKDLKYYHVVKDRIEQIINHNI